MLRKYVRHIYKLNCTPGTYMLHLIQIFKPHSMRRFWRAMTQR